MAKRSPNHVGAAFTTRIKNRLRGLYHRASGISFLVGPTRAVAPAIKAFVNYVESPGLETLREQVDMQTQVIVALRAELGSLRVEVAHLHERLDNHASLGEQPTVR